MQRVTVPLANSFYEIAIHRGLLAESGEYLEALLPSKRVIVIMDEALEDHVILSLKHSLKKAEFQVEFLSLKGGESTKSFYQLERMINTLLALKPDRRTTLIAVGGGVVGDLVGFAASILLRGVPFIQIPTTLLAQVDSSVGGKTGINTNAGKNLVGSFYQPLAVLIDTNTLDTLPDREMRAGYSEIVKYSLLGNADFFTWLGQHGKEVLARDYTPLSYAIATCCQMKANIVRQDEKESGMRALLNFGHTFGHALEAELGYDGRLLHGEAVSIGMVMAARLSARLHLCDEQVEQAITRHLKLAGLPVSPRDIDHSWNAEKLCQHLQHDKKTQNGKLTFILLRAIGNAVQEDNVDPSIVLEVIKSFIDD